MPDPYQFTVTIGQWHRKRCDGTVVRATGDAAALARGVVAAPAHTNGKRKSADEE
jgi:hypothetical protein